MLKLSYKNINKKLYEDYLNYLLYKYFDINLNNTIINNNSFLNFACFYPLPTSCEISSYKNDDEIINNNNVYEFVGKSSNHRIMFGNRLLPYSNTDPIPFTFPIRISDNTIELFNTNCFYYEVTICERIRDPWMNETLSIGFGSITTPIRCNPGWISDTVGYHLDDGSIQYNQIINKNNGPICNIGDTVGAGIVYVAENMYKFFFTFNGSIISNEYLNNNIIIKSAITTIVGYDHSCKIKINFGNDIFKFNIKNYCNTNFVISQNNEFINNHQFINKINTLEHVKKKIRNNTLFHFSENTSTSILAPSFSFSENPTLNNIILSIIANNDL